MPPLQPGSSRFAGGRPFVLGRFARGVQLQRCKAAFFCRLGNLEPVFDGLDAAACDDLSTIVVPGDQARRVDALYDVVAELGHQVALQELRLQALESRRARNR